MDDKHREILRRHWALLRKDLEIVKLLPDLVNVLDPADEDTVKAEGPERGKMIDKLLDILPRKGPATFDNFVEALQKTQSFLADRLLRQSEQLDEAEEEGEEGHGLQQEHNDELREQSSSRILRIHEGPKNSKLWKKVPTVQQLLPIIGDLGDRWHELGIALNLEKAEVYNIDVDYRFSREKARAVLWTWMEQKGRDATIGRLVVAMDQIGKKSTAQTLLEQLDEAEEEGEEGHGLQQENNDELREQSSSQILTIHEGQQLDEAEEEGEEGHGLQQENNDELREQSSSQILTIHEGQQLDEAEEEGEEGHGLQQENNDELREQSSSQILTIHEGQQLDEAEEEGEEGHGLQQENNDELREQSSSQILTIHEGQQLDEAEEIGEEGHGLQQENNDERSFQILGIHERRMYVKN
ncbi:hypothetical protein OS493_011388 [Desmophyllum pertusum]|uniref:Death domain-containing protein n=1 Tax=Desmophyllum pertusum TaxID=174260 RepID=A0A9X0CNA6_9CNID|nr:hypothetical protein OS493_011388 [Desmophyllum pertusum]